MAELVAGELSYVVIGAAMEVHRALGPGFLESIYQRAMEHELRARAVAFAAQRRVALSYKGEPIGDHVLDLVVVDTIVVELKAVKDFNELHQAQVISYLRATGVPVGLLFNFSKPSLEQKRILLKDSLRQAPLNPFNPLNPLFSP